MNFFDEDNNMRCDQVTKALHATVRRNKGELHGSFDYLVGKLFCEIGGPVTDAVYDFFVNQIKELGLRFFCVGSRLAYFESSGEIHLVDRETLEL